MSDVRVLVVDDSPIMQKLIATTLSKDPSIEVIGFANDPYEARQAIKDLSPDVITLDVEMPRMDGISFLEKLMRLRPTPVVMVSTLTQKGTSAAIKALMTGAVDCVGKPTGDACGQGNFDRLAEIVRHAAKANLSGRYSNASATPQLSQNTNSADHVVLIGASTGGVDALSTVLQQFPKDCPPTLIVQHMPKGFTTTFATRLNQICAANVAEAKPGAALENGQIYLAPGGDQHLVLEGRRHLYCALINEPPVNGHKPSVDRLFQSAQQFAERVSAVILTGMGSDGAKEMKSLRDAGARTFGQDRQSSTVYGMPRAAMQIGAVAHELPLSRIAKAVLTANPTSGAVV